MPVAAHEATSLDIWTTTDRLGGAGADPWLEVAAEVADRLAADVVQRDREGATPWEEARLLRSAGLLGLLVDRELGGEGQPYRTALEVVRRIARADSSIAHLLAYHYNFQTRMDSDLDRPLRSLQRRSVANGWIVASTGTPQDTELALRPLPDGGWSLTGTKSFATASGVAQRILGFVQHPDTMDRLVVEIDPERPGVEHLSDWDVLGQRLSASTGLRFDDYRVAADEVIANLGPDDADKPPHRTIGVLSFQLTFIFLYLGIAEGALLHARRYTRERTRAWVHSGVEAATADPYIQATYGELVSQVQALAALADQAERAAGWAHARGVDLTERERAEAAGIGAAAKVVATRTVLDVTSRVFEVTGARATQRSVGLDLYLRNARTHTLHSPVAWKVNEVGTLFLNDELATPSPWR